MTVRAATLADLPAIGRIQAAAPEAAQWDPAGYLAYHCLLAEEDGEALGFLVTRQTAEREFEILNLAVDLPARRRGVARSLLQVHLAQCHGAWFLEVRESNLRAIQFYESLGFQHAGTRQRYYYNPPEAGLVMKFNS